jgi:hypothetical protein
MKLQPTIERRLLQVLQEVAKTADYMQAENNLRGKAAYQLDSLREQRNLTLRLIDALSHQMARLGESIEAANTGKKR